MAPRFALRSTVAALAAILALVAAGCGKHTSFTTPLPNERPRLDLTAAPVNESDTAYYAYEIHWSGSDADGQIDHYEYAIDPRGGEAPETTWVRTSKTQETIFFRATRPDTDGVGLSRAIDPHTFVIRAFDDDGEWSAYQVRSFYSYTIAPSVTIVSPSPSPLISRPVAPNVRIRWEGRDDDGVWHRAPVQYKYRLLHADDPEYPSMTAMADPAAARRYFVSTGFAGWDSTDGETPFVQYTNLAPSGANGTYLFIVVGIDEAGAYSADWSLSGNMLEMNVMDPSTLGPRLTLSGEFFQYTYPSGVYAPENELTWVKLEVPAGRPFTVRWTATPIVGASVAWYRWKLDGDVSDETPRTDEQSDWYHWSAKRLGTTSATVGPALAPGAHTLYIEVMDDLGLHSLGVVRFNLVVATLARDLLVVDDTRLELDNFSTSGTRRNYTTVWPAAAELDTFLYAAGGFPWREPAAGRAGLSTPGLLAGYSFDTLGTRQGHELPSDDVPLSLLGQYRHVMWLVDVSAALKLGAPVNVANAISTLRWMSTPGRVSTLQAYVQSGGSAWLAGGAGAYTTTIEWNETGARSNDNIYGYGHTIFSSALGALGSGRFMYDQSRWQSELAVSRLITTVVRSSRAIGGWSHPGPGWAGTVNAPDYSRLPATLRRRALALGDTLPPTRPLSQSALFFTSDAQAIEYLTQPNSIIEDADPDPLVENPISTLDTLYEFRGGAIVTNITGQRPASMTYYHGMAGPPVVFTGFDLWSWTRSDCAALVDFVLHDIWGMNRRPAPARR